MDNQTLLGRAAAGPGVDAASSSPSPNPILRLSSFLCLQLSALSTYKLPSLILWKTKLLLTHESPPGRLYLQSGVTLEEVRTYFQQEQEEVGMVLKPDLKVKETMLYG